MEQPFAGLKKMALARSLQLQQNESSRLRDHVYNNFTTTEILDMLGGGRAVPAVPAEAAAAVAGGARFVVILRAGLIGLDESLTQWERSQCGKRGRGPAREPRDPGLGAAKGERRREACRPGWGQGEWPVAGGREAAGGGRARA